MYYHAKVGSSALMSYQLIGLNYISDEVQHWSLVSNQELHYDFCVGESFFDH